MDKKNIIDKNDFMKFFNITSCDLQDFTITHQKDGLHLGVTLAKKTSVCPVCLNRTSTVKDYTDKVITHSIISNRPCFIDYHARRYKCNKCHKTFLENNPFAMSGSKVSLTTVYNVLIDLKQPNETFKRVADRYHISPTTVTKIFDTHVHIHRLPLPEVVCIDEAYAFKSHNSKYVCVLTDFKTGDVIDVLPSRHKQDLIDYFYNIPLKERENVKVISFDMWKTYRDVARIMLPNSVCAIDHFHVKSDFHKRLDRVRIDTQTKYYARKKYLKGKDKAKTITEAEKVELKEASKRYYVLKKFNWMFFSKKNEIFDPNCEKKYNSVLEGYYNYYDIREYMLKCDEALELAFDLKYDLYKFYDNSSLDNAKKHLEELIKAFSDCPIPVMSEFSKTLTEWKYPIINSFIRYDGKRISNGLSENRNKTIKLLKHSSNGYLNWSRFRNRILYCMQKNATFNIYPTKREY